jgi:hypothetical protein
MKVACCVRDRLIPPANLLRSDKVRWRLRAATMGGDVAVLLLAVRLVRGVRVRSPDVYVAHALLPLGDGS